MDSKSEVPMFSIVRINNENHPCYGLIGQVVDVDRKEGYGPQWTDWCVNVPDKDGADHHYWLSAANFDLWGKQLDR